MKQLIFIYNADSGLLADAAGAFRKATTGSSLCSLCNITHGVISEKKSWAEFESRLSPDPIYFHRNDIPEDVAEFLREGNFNLPCILTREGDVFEHIIGSSDLDACKGSEECLIDLVKKNIA